MIKVGGCRCMKTLNGSVNGEGIFSDEKHIPLN